MVGNFAHHFLSSVCYNKYGVFCHLEGCEIPRGPAMRTTRELFTNIRRMVSPKELDKEDFDDMDFPAYLKNVMNERGIKPSDLIVQMNMEKSYFYQILKGRRAPGRDFLIHLSFLLKLNLDETQKLLKIANRQPLYLKKR